MKQKKCSDCLKNKKLDRFAPLIAGKFGRTSICKQCMTKRTRTHQKKLGKRGLCEKCGKNKKHTTSNYCLDCKWVALLHHYKLSKTEVDNKLKEQNYKCFLSGVSLVKGANASPDHSIPKSNGGAKGLDNINFVDADVNYAKQDLSTEDFLKMCINIYNYNKNNLKYRHLYKRLYKPNF